MIVQFYCKCGWPIYFNQLAPEITVCPQCKQTHLDWFAKPVKPQIDHILVK